MRCHASFLLLWFLQALRFIGPFRVIRNQWSQWSPCFTVIRHDTAVSVACFLHKLQTLPNGFLQLHRLYSFFLGGRVIRVSTGPRYVDQNMRLSSRNVHVGQIWAQNVQLLLGRDKLLPQPGPEITQIWVIVGILGNPQKDAEK